VAVDFGDYPLRVTLQEWDESERWRSFVQHLREKALSLQERQSEHRLPFPVEQIEGVEQNRARLAAGAADVLEELEGGLAGLVDGDDLTVQHALTQGQKTDACHDLRVIAGQVSLREISFTPVVVLIASAR
jgi:hypothetical protein